MNFQTILDTWLRIPNKFFRRDSVVDHDQIHCDCSGLIALLFDELQLKKPYGLDRPKAVHYFALLQEIGSDRIDKLLPGNLLAWRKNQLPKSGDTGHVLVIDDVPVEVAKHRFQVSVVDATKKANGLSRRNIELHTDDSGKIIGVRLHLTGDKSDAKVKRTAIYHHPLLNSRFCWGCGLPSRVCHCSAIESSLKTPAIVIFRHPKERKRTLSTVSLIKQRYPNVLVLEGEQFTPLRMPNLALLFPSDEALSEQGEGNSDQALILIDATWRKAKRMLHLNPWLQALPKVSLSPQRLSDYLLRKVSSEENLSSAEAFAAAANDRVLAGALKPFMDKHIQLMGEDVYQRNYKNHINYVDSE